jgi:hypothetical protein
MGQARLPVMVAALGCILDFLQQVSNFGTFQSQRQISIVRYNRAH